MKYLSILKYVLLIISALVVIGVAVTYTEGQESSMLNLMLVWALAMILLTIAAIIIMPLVGVFQNPKSAVQGLIGLGAIVVVFLVSYALSNDNPIPLPSGKVMDDSFSLKFSDTALYATYITFAGVIVSIIFGEFYKIFKK